MYMYLSAGLHCACKNDLIRCNSSYFHSICYTTYSTHKDSIYISQQKVSKMVDMRKNYVDYRPTWLNLY